MKGSLLEEGNHCRMGRERNLPSFLYKKDSRETRARMVKRGSADWGPGHPAAGDKSCLDGGS